MPFQEVVEAEGHLIDSHIMEHIFDKVVEYHGRFEVEQFRIGRTNSEPSYLRLKVETAGRGADGRTCSTHCSSSAARRSIPATPHLRTVERDRCAPEDFYSTTNHRTYVRIGQQWIEVENQRMDAMVVVDDGRAICRRLRDLRAGDQVVVGHARHPRHPRIEGARPPRVRLHVATASPRSARWKPRSGRPPRWCATRSSRSQKVVVVAGPVVVHTGGVAGLSRS